MSDINIRIDAAEDEVERLIARIDEAIAKRELLLRGPRIPIELRERVGEPPGVPAELREPRRELPGVPAELRPRVRIPAEVEEIAPGLAAEIAELKAKLDTFNLDVVAAEIATLKLQLQDAQNWLLQLHDKAEFDAILDPDKIQASLDGWVAQFESAEARAAWVEQRVDQVLLDVGGLDAILLRTEIQVQAVKSEVEAAEAGLTGLVDAFKEIDVPGLDRATRVLLMRVPILREILRLQGIIWRTQRALRLEGVRGPITAALTIVMAIWGIVQIMQKDQARVKAQMAELERRLTLRTITMEEALRGYGERPERYRTTVPP